MRILVLLWCFMLQAHATESFTIKSETRETDYTIGSIANQHLVVTVPKGFRLDEGSLPEQGLIEAIELQNAHWHFEDKKSVTVYHFDLAWQIFVASEAVKVTPLRNLELAFKRGKENLIVSVPADKVIISNLLPAQMDAAHVKPYPSVLPGVISTNPFIAALVAGVAGLLLSAIYFAWRLGWITLSKERSMAFRQAWRAIKQLRRRQGDDVAQAMQILSRAYDAFAGYAVSPENINRLFTARPALAQHESATLRFYEDLQSVFYAGHAPQHNIADIERLAHQLSKLEMP